MYENRFAKADVSAVVRVYCIAALSSTTTQQRLRVTLLEASDVRHRSTYLSSSSARLWGSFEVPSTCARSSSARMGPPKGMKGIPVEVRGAAIDDGNYNGEIYVNIYHDVCRTEKPIPKIRNSCLLTATSPARHVGNPRTLLDSKSRPLQINTSPQTTL